jgi:ABC-2 type transport system permease protein
VPPLIQLIIFGFAVNLDVEHARIAWLDADRTPESRELRAAFEGSGRFSIEANPASGAEAQKLLDAGEVQGVMRIFPGFGGELARGETTAVQVLVDGSDSNTASIVSSYAGQVVARFSADRMVEQMRAKLVGRTVAAGGPVSLGMPSVEARTRVWFNPDLRSRNYFVPGVVVNIVTLVTLMLTAMAIVREKEIGTMEQLMVTPIRPIELMAGKTLPFAIAGVVEVAFITTAALVVFGIPLRGSVLFLFATAILFLLTTVGAGLFLSTISQTQQQAVRGVAFLFHAGVPAERVRLPDPEHARAGAVAEPGEPDPVLHRDRARDLPEGDRHRSAVAAGAGAARLRDGDPGSERAEVPQAARLRSAAAGEWSDLRAGSPAPVNTPIRGRIRIFGT